MNDSLIIENIISKSRTKIAVSNYLEEDNMNKVSKFPKIVASIVITIGFMTGVVYASVAIHNQIWKQPEKNVGFYDQDKINIITEEEKQGSMNETEAREKAEEILKRFNHSYENIKTIVLESNSRNYELEWHIETDNGTSIRFNAKDANELKIAFNSILNNNIEQYRTTKEDAEKTARKLCENYGYALNKYDYVKVASNLNSEANSYIWYVDFYKKYDNLVNTYETISIAFVPGIDSIYYFNIVDKKFENNPIQVSEEQAKQSAIENDKKINISYEIKNIYIDLDIVQMNGDAYSRTTDYEQYVMQSNSNYPSNHYIDYRTENPIRKAWTVTIHYNVPDSVSNNPINKFYTYYIDVTTGEIIGGSSSYYIYKNNNVNF